MVTHAKSPCLMLQHHLTPPPPDCPDARSLRKGPHRALRRSARCAGRRFGRRRRQSSSSGRGRTRCRPRRTGRPRHPCGTSQRPGSRRWAAGCGCACTASRAPASTTMRPLGRAVKPSQRFQAGMLLPCGKNSVPTGSPAKMASSTPGIVPLAMMTDSPAAVARRAAQSCCACRRNQGCSCCRRPCPVSSCR